MRKFLFVAVMLPALASGAVYKCVDASGKTTFSDRACAGTEGGVKIDVKPASGAGTPVVPRALMSPEQRRISEKYDRLREKLNQPRRRRVAQDNSINNATCKEFSSTELRTLIIRNQVVSGMTTNDAVRAWGTPESVNGWQYAYDWGTNDWSFFYIKDGCVQSVSGAYRGGKFVK